MSSRRQYIDSTYLTSYLSGVTLNSDYTSEDDLISFAEEYIDAYVGPQNKWFKGISSSNGVYTPPDYTFMDTPVVFEVRGRVESIVDGQNFMLQKYSQNVFYDGYFVGCWIEIIGGTGNGQTAHIANSTYAGQITLQETLSTALDTTSFYRIYQLGKFPRTQDVTFDSFHQPNRFYKSIPDAVRRATAAQCLFMNQKGRAFFDEDGASTQSEHLGQYSYTRSTKGYQLDQYIAPDAKQILRGITRRMGSIR